MRNRPYEEVAGQHGVRLTLPENGSMSLPLEPAVLSDPDSTSSSHSMASTKGRQQVRPSIMKETDILVRARGRNIFIAERKFWRGSADLKNAIDQLLGYTSWRDTKAALLIFNRDTEMSTVVKNVPEAVQEHPNLAIQLRLRPRNRIPVRLHPQG